MAKLSTEMKRAIVHRLACFDTPTEVQEHVQEAFGVKVGLPTILYYDATKANPGLAQEWRDLFTATRERFVQESGGIAIMHRAYRLKELGDLYRRAKSMKNFRLALSILEQAAKEIGGVYTNINVHKFGEPVDALARELGLTPDEVRPAAVGMPESA